MSTPLYLEDPELTHAVELVARAGTRLGGRGLVVVAVYNSILEALYMTRAQWQADPLPTHQYDTALAGWLSGYDPALAYIVLECIQEGDDAVVQSFLMTYHLTESPLTAAA
jgi:hypothetical protein